MVQININQNPFVDRRPLFFVLDPKANALVLMGMMMSNKFGCLGTLYQVREVFVEKQISSVMKIYYFVPIILIIFKSNKYCRAIVS